MRPFYTLFVNGELKKVSLIYGEIIQTKRLHERMQWKKPPTIDIYQYTITESHPPIIITALPTQVK